MTGADGGYYISDEDYFVPDVAYISKERQPELPRKGFNPIPPDLAVEVVSPTDSYSEVARKVAVYLRGGTRLVWGGDPETPSVAVHTTAGTQTFGLNDTLDGGEALPGFALPIKDIFSG